MATVEKKSAKVSPSLWKKINSIQTQAGYVAKDTAAKMGSSSKMVASIESALDTYLPLCAEHGISIIPVSINITDKAYRVNQYGTSEFHIFGAVRYRAVDVETGDSHEFDVISYGMDSQDKATGKFLSYALKYAYYQLFSSRKGDDPDVPKEAEAPKQKQQQQQRAEPKQEAKPEPKPEPKQEEATDEDTGKREHFSELVLAIKEAFPIQSFVESQAVPGWSAYRPKVEEIIANGGADAEMAKHLNDFALFHWHCINLTCSKTLDKAIKAFESSRQKFAAKNIKYLEGIISKRQSAKSE